MSSHFHSVYRKSTAFGIDNLLTRFRVVILSILHLHYVANYANSSNPGITIVSVIVLQQVELCWSLISATIPNLKSFVKSFSSGFGLRLDPSQTQAYGSGRGARTANTYEMNSGLGNGTAKSRSAGRSYIVAEETPPFPAKGSLASKLNDGREPSIDSGGSQDHIIRKDVQWDIHYESEPGRAL